MLLRDWRGGELTILAAALVIAVTSLTSVGFFTDRVQQGMDRQASELIAADLALSSSRKIGADRRVQAEKLGMETAQTTVFRSVVMADGAPRLVEVKAVTAAYPLKGSLSITDEPFGVATETADIPAQGKAWAEAKLYQEMGLEVGDEITLGSARLTLTKILTYEPDRAGDLFSVAPRLMVNHSDVDASGLLGQGSLVTYHLLLSGEEQAIRKYKKQLEKELRPGESLLTVEDGRPELRSALERAEHFLGLAALISVLLAGVAITTAARRFAQRHFDTSAIMRCLGATQKRVVVLFTTEMLFLAMLASTVGCLFGYLTQSIIAQLMDQLLLANLPAPSYKPLMVGYGTGVILLLGFALPPIVSLKSVPPIRVLRKDITGKSVSRWLFYAIAILSMGLLLYWQVRDLKLVVTLIVGVLLTLALLALFGWQLILSLKGIRSRVGVSWRFGLANIVRRPSASITQIVAFGLGIMVLLLLSTVRNDLLDDWQRSLPDDAPNHFMINIQQGQVDGIRDYFGASGVETQLYPMVRARMTKVNGVPLVTDDFENERAKHLLTREFNLSWSDELPPSSRVINGSWWQQSDTGQPYLSLDDAVAKSLRIKLDDVITFDVNGAEQELIVTNLRKIDWDSFNVNFFTVSPSGILEQYPASWVTSIYLDEKQKLQLGGLVKRYPNVTVIDVGALMGRVRTIMDRVSMAVEFISLFTLLSGLAVLYAAIQSSQDERFMESAMLRTLGAKKKMLITGLVAEFVTLGAIAGLLGGVSATLLAWLLAEHVFKFEYTINLAIPLVGIISGITIVGISGYLGTRKVLNQPPVLTLRSQ